MHVACNQDRMFLPYLVPINEVLSIEEKKSFPKKIINIL